MTDTPRKAGRPRKDVEERSVPRSVALLPRTWQQISEEVHAGHYRSSNALIRAAVEAFLSDK